jgi:hypothetical protein
MTICFGVRGHAASAVIARREMGVTESAELSTITSVICIVNYSSIHRPCWSASAIRPIGLPMSAAAQAIASVRSTLVVMASGTSFAMPSANRGFALDGVGDIG